jgi:DNA-directed RNA polymerase subunit RPC12/RpoP
MDNKALLEAVNKAIEALEEVRRELLNVETGDEQEEVPGITIDCDPGAEVTIWPLGTGPDLIPKAESVIPELRPDPQPAFTEEGEENICPNCGMPYPAGSRFCMSCGRPLPEKKAAAPEPKQQLNVCPNCGVVNDPGSVFCMECGRPMSGSASSPAAKSAFCMNCGAPLEPGDKFCMKCGMKV